MSPLEDDMDVLLDGGVGVSIGCVGMGVSFGDVEAGGFAASGYNDGWLCRAGSNCGDSRFHFFFN